MTGFNKPYLLLRRLVIYNHLGKVAYDQTFHDRLNIIRGENSSGKSTIANFIFYALGGDFNNWTSEALLCTDVYAQVVINDVTLTLSRKVTDKSFQPMSIFYGSLDDAIKARNEGWMVYPYKQTENLKSFSNILFEALNYPETRADTDNKITMHQILRLMYIDQDSPIQNLFRFERFDLSLVRQAISELLLGIYDDSLYNDRLVIRDLRKDLDEKSKKLAGIKSAFKLTGNIITRGDIEAQIQHAEAGLAKLDEQILIVSSAENIPRNLNAKSNLELLQAELREAQEQAASALDEVHRLDDQILDSSFFLETLQKRIQAIEDSIYTKGVFGTMPIYQCPQCLNEIRKQETADICSLCKEPITVEENKSQSLRIKQELLLQIKESSELLKEKTERNNTNKINLKAILSRVRLKQKEFDLAVRATTTNRDATLNKLYSEKGAAEVAIAHLIEQRKIVELLETLSAECDALTADINRLAGQISDKEYRQKQRFEAAQTGITNIARYILQNDLPRQDEFRRSSLINIEYADDVFNVDGKFNFSASSNTYLKNAVRFAIFFASLSHPTFRYPRFILCDNVEDKGMEQLRSQNFQRIVARLSKNAPSNHQIILTTSMIDPELNNDIEICVGDFYTHENKTLKF